MNCKKMNVVTVLAVLLLAIFIGCQIDPPNPGGGNGNNGGGDGTGDQVTVTFVNKTGHTLVRMEYFKLDGTSQDSVAKTVSPAAVDGASFEIKMKKGQYNMAFFDAVGTTVGGGNGFDITTAKVIELKPLGGGGVDPTNDLVEVTFVNNSGKQIDELVCAPFDVQYPIERKHFNPPIAIGAEFKVSMKPMTYGFSSYAAPNSYGGPPSGLVDSISVTAGTIVKITPFQEPTDPTGDVTANFVNMSGAIIAEMRYVENSQSAVEQRKVFNPPIAVGATFKLSMKAGGYSFVSFPSTGGMGVKPTGEAYGVIVKNGAAIEFVPFVDNPTDPTNDIVITFNNKTDATLDAVYWKDSSDPSNGMMKVSIQPAAAPNTSFQLPFPNGVYDLEFGSELTGSATIVASLKSVPLSVQSNNIDVVKSTTNPAEQCIDFVNLYKEFTTVEYRFPGQPAWGTIIPDPSGQGERRLAVGENLSLPFAEGEKFDMRFTTASGEAVTLLNVTTAYRYGYINITGPATSSVAQEFGKRNRTVTLVNTTGETLTTYLIADQLKPTQPQEQQLATPLAPGKSTTITILEGIYSFYFVTNFSTAGQTDVTAVTTDLSIDIYAPPVMP